MAPPDRNLISINHLSQSLPNGRRRHRRCRMLTYGVPDGRSSGETTSAASVQRSIAPECTAAAASAAALSGCGGSMVLRSPSTTCTTSQPRSVCSTSTVTLSGRFSLLIHQANASEAQLEAFWPTLDSRPGVARSIASSAVASTVQPWQYTSLAFTDALRVRASPARSVRSAMRSTTH